MILRLLSVLLLISFLTPMVDAMDGNKSAVIWLIEETNEGKDAEEKSENTKEVEEDKLVSGQMSLTSNSGKTHQKSYFHLKAIAPDPHISTFTPPPEQK